MQEILAFFQEIFMLKDGNNKIKIGLSQFKKDLQEKKPNQKTVKIKKEVKLSDLMRKSA